MRRPVRVLAGAVAVLAGAATMLALGSPPAQAGGGLWKIDCQYSHSAADDPIVYPGQPGASHLHDFYGNASTNAYSTYSSMDGVKSTCTHNDRAAYWTPTLYRNGQAVHADGVIIYYDTGAYKAAKIEPFPKNFMMIAGNKNATTAAQVPNHVYWGCEDDSQIDYNRKVPPTSCPNANGIMLRVEFPSCWDGVTLNGNEIDHMRYPSGGNCPAGYPHAFPRIGFHVTYQFHNPTTGTITFSSGNVYSAHLDFWNTWDQATLETLTKTCLNSASNAGSASGPNCGHFKGNGGTPGKAVPAVDTSKSNATAGGATTTPTTSTPTPVVTTTPSTPATKAPSTPATKAPSTPATKAPSSPSSSPVGGVVPGSPKASHKAGGDHDGDGGKHHFWYHWSLASATAPLSAEPLLTILGAFAAIGIGGALIARRRQQVGTRTAHRG